MPEEAARSDHHQTGEGPHIYVFVDAYNQASLIRWLDHQFVYTCISLPSIFTSDDFWNCFSFIVLDFDLAVGDKLTELGDKSEWKVSGHLCSPPDM